MNADELDDFEAELQGWLSAYPLTMFPEPDLKMAAMLLKAGGMTLDSISASNMRHVVSKIAPQALALVARHKEMREALEPFAAMRLSTEPEVSDCVHRSAGAEMRRRADAADKRDNDIRNARATLTKDAPHVR